MSSPRAASGLPFEGVLVKAIKVVLALVALTPLIVTTKLLPDWHGFSWLLPPTLYPFVVGKALYFQLLAQVAFGLWLLLFLRNPSYRVPRSAILIAFAVYVLVNLVSSLLGVSPQRSLWSNYERMQGFVSLAHGLVFIWVLVSVNKTWSDWRALLNTVLAGAVIVAVLGVGQNFGLKITPPKLQNEQAKIQEDDQRLEITLGNATYVGSYMLMGTLVATAFLARSFLKNNGQTPPPTGQANRKRTGKSGGAKGKARRAKPRHPLSPNFWLVALLIPVGLSFLQVLIQGSTSAYALFVIVLAAFGGSYCFLAGAQRESWWRAFWIAAIAFCLYAMFLSGTRSPFFTLACAGVAFVVAYALMGQVKKWVCLAAVGFVGVLLLMGLLVFAGRNTPLVRSWASSSVLVKRLLQINPSDFGSKGRVTSIQTGLRGFADRPVFGWGPENYQVAYNRHVTVETVNTVFDTFDQAHNKLIEELVTNGAVGLAAYLAVWAFVFAKVWRRAKRQMPREQLHTMLIGAALFGYFVQNLFLFDTPSTVVWFLVLIGYAAYLETATEHLIAGVQTKPPRPLQTPAPLVRLSMIFRSKMAYGGVAAAVVLVVALAIHFFVGRPFTSSVLMCQAYAIPHNLLMWEDRLDLFEQAFAKFPYRANEQRIIMLEEIKDELEKLTPKDAARTLRFVEKAEAAVLRSEPENWEVRLFAAIIYWHQAASLDPRYLALAGERIRKARELFPSSSSAAKAEIVQCLKEGNPKEAQAILEGYVAQYPACRRYFRTLQERVEKAIEKSRRQP